MQLPSSEFSIVIPTINRPAQLADCLAALTRLDYPRERVQVIVVDDGGAVSLDAVIARFQDALDVALLRQSNAGPAAARNTGAARARGKYLAFTDDDCAPAPSWLAALAAHLTTEANLMVGGRTINALPDNLFASASQLILDTVYDHYNRDPQNARFFATNNLAFPADAFRALGGFNPAYRTSEDRDLCDRWLGCGCRLMYAPGAVVYHSHHLAFRAFWQQHVEYGRGAFRYNRARARRAALETGFYLALPSRLRELLSRMTRRRALALTMLMLVWQIANAAGFAREAIRYATRR